MIKQIKRLFKEDKVMRNIKIILILSGMLVLFAGNVFATTSSQILVMSNQLYQIAKDLTTGIFPTSILLIAIGMWGMVNAFGKGIGDGIHQLTNIKGTRHIELLVFLKEADKIYSVEWKEAERDYDNQLLGEAHYKALISVVQIPQGNEEQYKENPLDPFGLYVTSISWSKLI